MAKAAKERTWTFMMDFDRNRIDGTGADWKDAEDALLKSRSCDIYTSGISVSRCNIPTKAYSP